MIDLLAPLALIGLGLVCALLAARCGKRLHAHRDPTIGFRDPWR